MPYILVHPLPPPHRNPYYPELPTFTTSSRAMAHFFHSHGWRARHVCAAAPTSLECSSTSSSRCSALGASSTNYIDAVTLSLTRAPAAEDDDDDDDEECCRASAETAVVSCGKVVELHDYGVPIDSALFGGPRASDTQVAYLRYYAWGRVEFGDAEGRVDLRVLKGEAVAQRRERVESEKVLTGEVRSHEKETDEDVFEDVLEEMDEDIDEELGKQWELAERALLATGELEWAETGKTLRNESSRADDL